MSDKVAIKRAYSDSRWGQVHYRIARPTGAATHPPLLMIHQTPKSGWEYEPLMPDLGRDRVVIAPDTPGYGASDAPPAPVTIPDYAEVFAQLMTDLAQAGVVPAGPFDMMGMHTGSVTTTQMSVAYPDRVRRAIMLGLAAYDDETRKAKLLSLGTYPMPKNDLSHIEAMWQNLQDLFDPRSTIEYRHKSMSENLRSVPRMPWGYEAVYRYDFRKALTEVTQPVMVLCPDDDLSEVTSQTAGLLPHGRMVRIPEAKHGLLVLETDRMAGLIRGFLDAETVA